MPHTLYLLFFSANLAFILTNLYGWLLKWFYRPKAYDEEFQRLFPAQRSVGWLYLLQVMELPYLLNIIDHAAAPMRQSVIVVRQLLGYLQKVIGTLQQPNGTETAQFSIF